MFDDEDGVPQDGGVADLPEEISNDDDKEEDDSGSAM